MFQTHLPFIGINLVLQDEFVQQVCTASSISHQPFKFLLSKTVSMCQYRIGHNPHTKSNTICTYKNKKRMQARKHRHGYRGAAPAFDAAQHGCGGRRCYLHVGIFFFFSVSRYTSIHTDSRRIKSYQLAETNQFRPKPALNQAEIQEIGKKKSAKRTI